MEARIRTADGAAPLRLDLAPNPSARALAARVREGLAGRPVLAVEEADGPAPLGIALRAEGGGALGAWTRTGPCRTPPPAWARTSASCAGPWTRSRSGGVLELPLLTPEERAERRRWNATGADLPHGVCLHQAFEAGVDAHPDAAAVLYGDETVSYGELEARANRLAHHLRGRGVGPESRVGICVERGPRVVEAILAVLKAGGAYVPWTPRIPRSGWPT